MFIVVGFALAFTLLFLSNRVLLAPTIEELVFVISGILLNYSVISLSLLVWRAESFYSILKADDISD